MSINFDVYVDAPPLPEVFVVEPPAAFLVDAPSEALLVEPVLPDFVSAPSSDDSIIVPVAGPPGPAGPEGPQGPAGTGSGSAEQNFPVASDEWVFDHNLGFTPAVMTYDPLGVQIRGLVIENGPARTVVSYFTPVAGRMTLS